jgi:hypothetical protein
MELKKFITLESLNEFLKTAKNVKKVKLLTEGGEELRHFKLITVFYVLFDNEGEYQKNIEDIGFVKPNKGKPSYKEIIDQPIKDDKYFQEPDGSSIGLPF